MRVVKKGSMPGTYESLVRQAHADEGCSVCPNCGENKSADDYFYDSGLSNRGIFSSTTEEWEDNAEKVRRIRKDHFYCLTCKARWEGKPYVWEPREFKKTKEGRKKDDERKET